MEGKLHIRPVEILCCVDRKTRVVASRDSHSPKPITIQLQTHHFLNLSEQEMMYNSFKKWGYFVKKPWKWNLSWGRSGVEETGWSIDVVNVNLSVIIKDFIHVGDAFRRPVGHLEITDLFGFVVELVWYYSMAPCIFQQTLIVVVVICFWISHLQY